MLGWMLECQSIQIKWLSERCENFLGYRLGQLACMNAFEQHHKLVPDLATVSSRVRGLAGAAPRRQQVAHRVTGCR